jgi:hypothetical protein
MNAMKKILLLAAFLLCRLTAFVQFSPQWVNRIGGLLNDIGFHIATDATGNVVITGYFNGTVDFDPGTDTFNLVSGTGNDIFLAKYDPSGSLLFAYQFGTASGNDIGTAVHIDGAGNIYLGAEFGNTVDFDPGAGVANFTALGFTNGILVKYSSAGVFQWGFAVASATDSGVESITTNAAGDVFFSGAFWNTVDFDPGAGIANLTAVGNSDVFFAKFSSAGTYQLAKSFGGTANDVAFYLNLDNGGNILVSGYFVLTVDFDPGANVNNLTSAGANDVFFAKYDASGNYLWARRIGAATNDGPGGLVVMSNDDVVVGGFFAGTFDFDPGAGVVNLSPVGGADLFFARYTANGDLVWAKRIGSSGTDGSAANLVSDGAGGFFVAIDFAGTIDADPDAGVVNFATGGSSDILLARYSSDGNFITAGAIGSPSADNPFGTAAGGAGTLLITGYFQGTADFDPGTGVLAHTSAGSFDIFIGKYIATGGVLPVRLSDFFSICNNSGVQLQWSTAQEADSKSFVVEKSSDGLSFQEVGTVAATGLSYTTRWYRFNLHSVDPGSFFRLRMVDNDGRQSYSKIITAPCKAARTLYVHPNPAKNKIFVQKPAGFSNVVVQVSSATGVLMEQLRDNSHSVITLDGSRWPAGVYLITVRDVRTGKEQTARCIKE